MKPRNLLLAVLVSIVLILVLSVTSLLIFNTRRMLPQHDGLAFLPELGTSVEIIRDEYGVPHIYADNVHDLFYAQGYVHAQDRWWQMEFERHVGQGRIGELTGYNPSVLGNDLFIRTVGWNRSSAADMEVLSGGTNAALAAYAQGVNTYIEGKSGGALALEYTLLGVTGVNIEVDPWTPLDSMSWAKVMSWGQSGNWSAEMDRMTLYEQQDQRFMDRYDPYYPLDARPTIMTEADLPLSDASLAANFTPNPQAIAAVLSPAARGRRGQQ
jgi:penicillin amidase